MAWWMWGVLFAPWGVLIWLVSYVVWREQSKERQDLQARLLALKKRHRR